MLLFFVVVFVGVGMYVPALLAALLKLKLNALDSLLSCIKSTYKHDLLLRISGHVATRHAKFKLNVNVNKTGKP